MEVVLSFFIVVTIFIDTLSMSIKGVSLKRRFVTVYVVSQALTYITRFSLFFILPIIGFILDGFFEFNLNLFFQVFSFFLVLHSTIFLLTFNGLSRKLKYSIYKFPYNLKEFFYSILFIFSGVKMDFSLLQDRPKPIYIYAISHFFLSLVFPILLLVGFTLNEYRATIMGVVSIYTGVFSLYILFFIERKVSSLDIKSRVVFVRRLIFSKALALFSSALFLLVLSSFF